MIARLISTTDRARWQLAHSSQSAQESPGIDAGLSESYIGCR